MGTHEASGSLNMKTDEEEGCICTEMVMAAWEGLQHGIGGRRMRVSERCGRRRVIKAFENKSA